MHPNQFNGYVLTEAARHLLQIQPQSFVFLRTDDTVQIQLPPPSTLRLQFKVGDAITATVQVNSSIPMADESYDMAGNPDGHHQLHATNASVQISQSMPDQHGASTPVAKGNYNVVQETPATLDRHYNALSNGSKPDGRNLSDQSSRNETQIKDEEESQLVDNIQYSSPHAPNSKPHSTVHESPPTTEIMIASAPVLSVPRLQENDETESESESESDEELVNRRSEGTGVADQHSGLRVTSSTPASTSTSDKSKGQKASDERLRIHEEHSLDKFDEPPQKSIAEQASTLSDEVGASGGSTNFPSFDGELVKQVHMQEERGLRLETESTKKRRSNDDFEQPTPQPSRKRHKSNVDNAPEADEETSEEEASEDGAQNVIRPQTKIAVVIPNPLPTRKQSLPSQATVNKPPTRLYGKKTTATGSKRASETPIRSSARVAATPSSSIGSNKSNMAGLSASSSASVGRPSSTPFSGKGLRVIFSNSTIPQKPSIMKFFTSQGGKSIKNPTLEFDFLVIGNGELKKTSKLLMAIALGKHIATDAWIAQSAKAGKMLESSDFTPSDAEREDGWGITIADIMGKDRRRLFDGKTILVTTALKKEYGAGYSDIEELAQTVGVKAVVKYTRDAKAESDTIVLARERDDLDAVALMGQGTACYSRDLLSISIMRGTLDLECDEFRIVPPSSGGTGKKGKVVKGRKSG